MRIKRLTLIAKIKDRIESDRATHEAKQDKFALENARHLRVWEAMFAPEWDEFVSKAKTLRKAGQPIPYEIIPKATDRYNDKSVQGACHDNFVREPFEPDDNLALFLDVLESSEDETVETKELGITNLLKSLS